MRAAAFLVERRYASRCQLSVAARKDCRKIGPISAIPIKIPCDAIPNYSNAVAETRFESKRKLRTKNMKLYLLTSLIGTIVVLSDLVGHSRRREPSPYLVKPIASVRRLAAKLR